MNVCLMTDSTRAGSGSSMLWSSVRCVGMAGTWPGQSVFGMTHLISLCLGLEDEKERVCQQLHTVWTGQEAFQTTERNQLCFMNFRYAFGQIKRIILTIQFALLRIRFIQHHTTLFLTHSFYYFMIWDFSFKCLPMPAMAKLSFCCPLLCQYALSFSHWLTASDRATSQLTALTSEQAGLDRCVQ